MWCGLHANERSVFSFCVPSYTLACSFSALPLSQKCWLPLYVMSLCNKKVFIKMIMPLNPNRWIAFLHFLRFVHLLVTLHDKRRDPSSCTTWTEPGGNRWNKRTHPPEKKKKNLNYYRIHSCVLSSHFNAAAGGGVSYHSCSYSQRKTVSQGHYQGSPAIWAIASSDGRETGPPRTSCLQTSFKLFKKLFVDVGEAIERRCSMLEDRVFESNFNFGISWLYVLLSFSCYYCFKFRWVFRYSGSRRPACLLVGPVVSSPCSVS